MAFGTLIHYKGYTLKSRIEFAWAQTFEAEGFEWEYEGKTFRAGRKSYTPDFVIEGHIYIEIKVYGAKNLKNKFHLCTSPLLLIFGTPDHHYVHFKPAEATRFVPAHFTSWALAYQKALA